MKNIPFYKAHGTGNDFIFIIDDPVPELCSQPEFISRICARRTGIGADALILLSPCSDYDFKMDYYNSDGSWETMCANASRCAAKIMYQEKRCGKSIKFLAGDGPHEMEILHDGQVRLKMTPPVYKSKELILKGHSGFHVDSGAPHFVCPATELNEAFVATEAPPIRYHEMFAPRGINVNFYSVNEPSHIQVITYEKMIEKVMLSCGSGSVASVFHAAKVNNLESPVTISAPGGDLSVEFDENWQDVWLTGPAVILFQSQINPTLF